MEPLVVVTLVLQLSWGGDFSAEASGDVWSGDDPADCVVLSPLVLTWTPADGFGASSSVQASKTVLP